MPTTLVVSTDSISTVRILAFLNSAHNPAASSPALTGIYYDGATSTGTSDERNDPKASATASATLVGTFLFLVRHSSYNSCYLCFTSTRFGDFLPMTPAKFRPPSSFQLSGRLSTIGSTTGVIFSSHSLKATGLSQ